MKEHENYTKSESTLWVVRKWNQAPVLVKALIIGFLVNTIGVGSWILTISLVPYPWALMVMAFLLVIYIKYFSGSWAPRSTSRSRVENFRLRRLTIGELKWGLVAAALFVGVFQSGLMLTFRIMEYPEELFKAEYNLDAWPVGSAWPILIMASLVAGICEETGFRGYMQVPLEKKYGPTVAIGVVSFVFVLVHLHQAWAWPILIQIFAAGAFIGILAYRTGSLLPGFMAHFILDIFNFSYWWSDLLGKFERRPVFESGVDSHFIFWLIVFILSVVLFFRVTKLASRLHHTDVAS